MKPDGEQPRENPIDGEADERRRHLRWTGVITVAAIVAALLALLFHGPSRALPMPPAFAMPLLAVMTDGVDGEEGPR